jgi:peroxiredoxin
VCPLSRRDAHNGASLQEFKNKGFVIVAVSVKDKKTDALAFIKELKLTYPVVFDPEGRWGYCTALGRYRLLI